MIHKEGLVPVPEFAKEHGLSRNNLYILHSTGNQFLVKDGKQLYVDTTKLYLRKEFRHKVWLETHELYYIFLEAFGSEYKLAQWLSKYIGGSKDTWTNFMNQHLFCLPPDDALKYKVPKRMWKMYRALRAVLRLNGRRIESIYKRLPNRDLYEKICKERGCER